MVVLVLVLYISGGFERHGLGLILAAAAADLAWFFFFFSSSEFGLLDCVVLSFKTVSFGISRTDPKPI